MRDAAGRARCQKVLKTAYEELGKVTVIEPSIPQCFSITRAKFKFVTCRYKIVPAAALLVRKIVSINFLKCSVQNVRVHDNFETGFDTEGALVKFVSV